MNTTSLSISKRLYELSGWGERCEVDKMWKQQGELWSVVDSYQAEDRDGFIRAGYVPAYTLGELLRKLPRRVGTYDGLELDIDQYYGETTIWRAAYVGMVTGKINQKLCCTAATPEDAAGLLAIKLLEEGIITKEKE